MKARDGAGMNRGKAEGTREMGWERGVKERCTTCGCTPPDDGGGWNGSSTSHVSSNLRRLVRARQMRLIGVLHHGHLVNLMGSD